MSEQVTQNASEIMVPLVTLQEINPYDYNIMMEQDLTKAGTDDEWAFFTTEWESWRQEATQEEFQKFKADGHFDGNFIKFISNDKLVFWVNQKLGEIAQCDIKSGAWESADDDERAVKDNFVNEYVRVMITDKMNEINKQLNENKQEN